MVHLCSAKDPFHARVIAARLGAEGILAQVRGDAVGPYPITTEIEVVVPEDELDAAREILLFDDLEAPVTAARQRSPGVQRVIRAGALLLLSSMAIGTLMQIADLLR